MIFKKSFRSLLDGKKLISLNYSMEACVDAAQ